MTKERTVADWLAESRKFLLQHGRELLKLEPGVEQIEPAPGVIGGVTLTTDVGGPVRIGGLSMDLGQSERPDGGLQRLEDLLILNKSGEHRQARSLFLDILYDYTGLRWRDNTDPTDQIPFVIYSNMSRTLNAEVLWFRGLGDEANIDLKLFPGKAGNRYGRFYIPGTIPENVMSTSSGLPMKDVISCFVTDPHDLRICYMRPLTDKTLVLFEGADQLTRCVPVFRYQEMAERFAEEVGKLAEARAIMRKQLSTSALSDGWWDAFEAYVEAGAARPFKPRYIRYGAKVWRPADRMRELLATGR